MKKLQFKTLICLVSIAFSFSVQAQYVWTQKTSFPGNARWYAACFSIGHYGYVGCGAGSSNYTDWYRWDKNTGTWSSIAPYPGAGQVGNTYFSIGGKGYVGLGKGLSAETDLWSYDTTSNTWTQMTSFPGVARYSAYAFVIGTNAYVCTGNPGAPPYRTDCWMYNSVTDKWKQIADYPIANNETTLVYSIGKYGYAGCGGNGTTLINNMYKYDTGANTWTAITSVPVSGGGLNEPANFVLNDTAYSVSGSDNSNYYLHDFYAYNSMANSWSVLPAFPGTPRWYGIGFTIGNCGYVVTGNDSIGGHLADLWQYGPIPTGINVINASEITTDVYPNPSSGILNFTFSNLNIDNAKLIITDLLGRTISEHIIDGKTGKLSIDGSQFNNGVYFYRVNSAGVSVSSGKFVIEK